MDLSHWSGAPTPEHQFLEGRYARLEPLDPDRHASSLFDAAVAPGADERFKYLAEFPPADRKVMYQWASAASARSDSLFYAVVDRQTGRAEGRQSLMRLDPRNGVVEVGNIMWGPRLTRTRVATEAIFLFAKHVFELGYRRLEWKCNDANLPSKKAAERFGFTYEGLFRQHMVVKGRNRDTAWFSMIDTEWPQLRTAYEAWLDPENFDESGCQKRRLATS